jgi:hypothetical protein
VRSLLPGVRDLRVRDLGDAVRVEVDEDLVDAARETTELYESLAQAGFEGQVEVRAFRSGSMNVLLPDPGSTAREHALGRQRSSSSARARSSFAVGLAVRASGCRPRR